MIILRSDVIQSWSELTALAPRAKVEQPFRVIKQHSGFQQSQLRGMAKNRCKINVLAALTNRFMARRQLLAKG